MNPLYELLNAQYIQQAQKQYHDSQIEEIRKSAKALYDFLDSNDKIAPEYRKMAQEEYCAIFYAYMKKHGMI